MNSPPRGRRGGYRPHDARDVHGASMNSPPRGRRGVRSNGSWNRTPCLDELAPTREARAEPRPPPPSRYVGLDELAPTREARAELLLLPLGGPCASMNSPPRGRRGSDSLIVTACRENLTLCAGCWEHAYSVIKVRDGSAGLSLLCGTLRANTPDGGRPAHRSLRRRHAMRNGSSPLSLACRPMKVVARRAR